MFHNHFRTKLGILKNGNARILFYSPVLTALYFAAYVGDINLVQRNIGYFVDAYLDF